MPHKIIAKERLSEDVFAIEAEANFIAQARKPGQFIILGINNDYSERIPLTIADVNINKGTIKLIFQRVGKTCRITPIKSTAGSPDPAVPKPKDLETIRSIARRTNLPVDISNIMNRQ